VTAPARAASSGGLVETKTTIPAVTPVPPIVPSCRTTLGAVEGQSINRPWWRLAGWSVTAAARAASSGGLVETKTTMSAVTPVPPIVPSCRTALGAVEGQSIDRPWWRLAGWSVTAAARAASSGGLIETKTTTPAVAPVPPIVPSCRTALGAGEGQSLNGRGHGLRKRLFSLDHLVRLHQGFRLCGPQL